MNCTEKFNNAIDYIEAHLTDEIDYEQAARKACCSAHHFQRMFSFIADITLSEYIRRRRLTLAAFDLCNKNAKIIDIAAKYGYKSPEAFSRAFKSLHGVMPIAVRDTDVVLKAFPRLSFRMTMEGNNEVSYRIVHKKAHTVCGIKTEIPLSNSSTNTMITQFWEENMNNGILGQFHRDIGLAYDVCLNAALYNYRQNAFSYMICHDAPSEGTPLGYDSLSIPPMTWVVFSTPKHAAQETTALVRCMRERIFLEWFPTSGYIHAGCPEFEMFKEENEKYIIEVWIPVIKVS